MSPFENVEHTFEVSRLVISPTNSMDFPTVTINGKEETPGCWNNSGLLTEKLQLL
jgi:hypothetical protein